MILHHLQLIVNLITLDANLQAKSEKVWVLFCDNDAQNETPLHPQERVEVEISRYLDLPVVEIDSDPLQWWKHEEKRLPVLAVLAKKYLCMCGTSVPSE